MNHDFFEVRIFGYILFAKEEDSQIPIEKSEEPYNESVIELSLFTDGAKRRRRMGTVPVAGQLRACKGLYPLFGMVQRIFSAQ